MLNGEPGNQANVEYFFRLIYECLRGGCGTVDLSWLAAFLSSIWLWIIYIGYAIAVVALFVIVYCTMRIFELRHREEEYYSTLITSPDAESDKHPRWEHIQSLAAGDSVSGWREAIIEADIMLDELLSELGYAGVTISDKLKSADSLTFASIQEAWDAHKVRNQIAHEGSKFVLTADLARRTIARYESVFREFKVI